MNRATKRDVVVSLCSLAVIGAVLLVSRFAFAVPGADVVIEAPPVDESLNVAQQVLMWAGGVAVGLLGIVGSFVLLRVNAFLKAKTGLTLGSDEQLQAWADHAIALAEEKSRERIKRGASALAGPVKLEEAISFMLERVKERGLENVAESKLRDLVLARLGMSRSWPPTGPLPPELAPAA